MYKMGLSNEMGSEWLMNLGFELESGYRGCWGMWKLDKDCWLLKSFQRYVFCEGWQSWSHACHFAFFDRVSQAWLEACWVICFGYVLLERFWRDWEPGSIMGQGSWERSIACWKCREIINNRKDLPYSSWNLLELWKYFVEITGTSYLVAFEGL